MTNSILNSLGVISSTIGAFLVLNFLKERNFSDTEAFVRGEGVLTVPNPTTDEVRRHKLAIFLSNFGLALILFGGALPVISNHF